MVGGAYEVVFMLVLTCLDTERLRFGLKYLLMLVLYLLAHLRDLILKATDIVIFLS